MHGYTHTYLSSDKKMDMATGTEEVLECPLSEVHDYKSILVQKE